MKQRPVAIGLFLCEQVIVEERTGNVTPVNCFTHRPVEQFPSEPFPFVVFAILTDGSGEMPLEVLFHRLDTLDVVYRRRFSFRFSDPLQNVRCILRLRDCSFPVPTHYQVTLLADAEMVAQRKFAILRKENNQ